MSSDETVKWLLCIIFSYILVFFLLLSYSIVVNLTLVYSSLMSLKNCTGFTKIHSRFCKLHAESWHF